MGQSYQAHKQQVQANQVRDQLRKSNLREQQRQQSSNTTRKAFQSSKAKSGIDHSDNASHDRYREQQRDQVDDYVNKSSTQSSQRGTHHPKPAKSKPAHASSSH